MATRAPRSANALATASPMPWAAPVTIAVRPSKLFGSTGSLLGTAFVVEWGVRVTSAQTHPGRGWSGMAGPRTCSGNVLWFGSGVGMPARGEKRGDHVCGAAQMRSQAAGRQFRISCLVCIHDLSVLLLGYIETVQDAEAHAQIALHLDAQIIRKLEEVRLPAGASKRIVKFAVEGEPPNWVSLMLPSGEDSFRLFQVFTREVLDGASRD